MKWCVVRTETQDLVGIGLYTTTEAQKLTGTSSQKIRRWLLGYSAHGKQYDPLWNSQVHLDEESDLYLGFRDLTEVRVVNALINQGLSAQSVRKAIVVAREVFGKAHPLSTTAFKTDGQSIFYEISSDADDAVIDLIKGQYAMKKIIEPSFKGLDFNEAGEPMRWRIASGVVVDPEYAFGQPIEELTHVPTKVLADAVKIEGSIKMAAIAFDVPEKSVRQALKFEEHFFN